MNWRLFNSRIYSFIEGRFNKQINSFNLNFVFHKYLNVGAVQINNCATICKLCINFFTEKPTSKWSQVAIVSAVLYYCLRLYIHHHLYYSLHTLLPLIDQSYSFRSYSFHVPKCITSYKRINHHALIANPIIFNEYNLLQYKLIIHILYLY